MADLPPENLVKIVTTIIIGIGASAALFWSALKYVNSIMKEKTLENKQLKETLRKKEEDSQNLAINSLKSKLENLKEEVKDSFHKTAVTLAKLSTQVTKTTTNTETIEKNQNKILKDISDFRKETKKEYGLIKEVLGIVEERLSECEKVTKNKRIVKLKSGYWILKDK